MAAKVLDDILNSFLSLDTLLKWLCNKSTPDEEKIFLNQYDCSKVEFVSYFLIFLREQSSRDFQLYDVETPRKNSHPRLTNSSSASNCTFQKKSQTDYSPEVQNMHLDSLQSFPSLSSSIKIDSCEKRIESTPCSDLQSSCQSERKLKRVQLFSETLAGNYKETSDMFNDIEPIDKFAMSTPKLTTNHSIVDYFNASDLQGETSPKIQSKPKWKNRSFDLSSPEISNPKSRSFSGGESNKSKDPKVNSRISLADFILNDSNDGKKDRKTKAKKRINPVRVSQQCQLSFNSSFIEKTDTWPDSTKLDALEDRCLKASVNKPIDNAVVEDVCLVKSTSNEVTEKQAEVNSVTHASELKILSHIYSCLIDENYCQNIMMELCFVISLLVIQDYNKKLSDLELGIKALTFANNMKFFSTIHNCVYFAVEMLWLQKNFLLFLNLSSLKLLCENTRIQKFNPRLQEYLVNAYSKKQSSEEIKRHYDLIKAGMQGNVSFQYETDNRENFTSGVSFQSFRKQRDLFYNILAIWEANHLVSGWIFSVGLGSKIRSLLSICSNPINLLHLSRLFRDQLITSCCGESQCEEDLNEEILQLLPSADPNKIQRLRARLTSSPKRLGLCSLPDFTGNQEFFKDFILCTSYSGFHEHLKNSLCDEILRLNDTELTGDIEDDDLFLDEQTQERYLQCTNILRLLAKFLGFVQFLPYRGEKPVSDKILSIHCSVRHNTLPLFDVEACLESSMKKQKLTLTIPWMVSYLSMIDPYSANLKSFQIVWRLLINIYKNSKTMKNSKNAFYLKLMLGWLFQLPNFPSEQFYSFLDDCNSSETSTEDTKVGLDSYEFIEEAVLYTVCPYLNEISVILSENLGCNVKHIRPSSVTTQENSGSKSQALKQLQLRLESNFLHNQSSSVRKTVEFVTERVASVAIKHLVYNVIPKIKEKAWSDLEKIPMTDIKQAEAEAEVLSGNCYKELLVVCEQENWEISSRRSEMAVKALLSEDLIGSIAEACSKIVTRQAMQKVERWLKSHVTLGIGDGKSYDQTKPQDIVVILGGIVIKITNRELKKPQQTMMKKEFLSIIQKMFAKKMAETKSGALEGNEVKTISQKDSYHLPPEGRAITHNETAWPASRILKFIRESIWKVLEGKYSSENVEQAIEEAGNTLVQRNDMVPAAETILISLIVDLVVITCITSNKDISHTILKKFFHFIRLQQHQSVANYLEKIVCPRNMAIVLKESKSRQDSWRNLANLLMSLLEEKLLTVEQVETQLLSLLRQNWSKEEGIEFADFVLVILTQHSKTNGCDKFSLLLEYIIDTLKEDEAKSESFG